LPPILTRSSHWIRAANGLWRPLRNEKLENS
jgi:hypothetical protein